MNFIILGDLHYTDYNSSATNDKRDRFFDALFQRLAEQGADLIFAIGDIVHYGTASEFKGLYAAALRYGIQMISITGNHDTATFSKNDLRPYFAAGKSTAPDELYHAFSYQGTRFVLLDTGREMECDTDWSGYVSSGQQQWLKTEVTDFNQGHTGDNQLVVLGHHPLYGTTSISSDWRMNIDNSEEVRLAMGQVEAGRAFYICGHNHVNDIVGPDSSGWSYIQCGAPLVSFCFRLISAGQSGLKVDTVDFGLDDQQLIAALPDLYAGLEHFTGLSLAQAAGGLQERARDFRQQDSSNTLLSHIKKK